MKQVHFILLGLLAGFTFMFVPIVHADVVNTTTVKQNYNGYRIKNTKKSVYLFSHPYHDKKGIQKLNPKTTYYQLKQKLSKGTKYIYLTAYDNNLKHNGYVALADVKSVPVKSNRYYESSLDKKVRKLFPVTIHDQYLQRTLNINADEGAENSGDFGSDLLDGVSQDYPIAKVLMDLYPKINKNDSVKKALPLIKRNLQKQLSAAHQSFNSFKDYHIAVKIYPRQDYLPYSIMVILNKPDVSNTNWSDQDVYNYLDNQYYQQLGNHFSKQLNQAATKYAQYLTTANDVSYSGPVNDIGSALQKKLGFGTNETTKYRFNITSVNLDRERNWNSIIARLHLYRPKSFSQLGIAIQMNPGSDDLTLVQAGVLK